jgi:antirestriction protein ArdC
MAGIQQAEHELQKLVDVFSTEEFPNFVKKAYLETEGKPSESWSLSNQIIQMLSSTSDSRTFKAWQEVNRNVKKGSKALYILQPSVRKYTVKSKQNEEEEKQYMTFFASPRFRIEDTEGTPLPKSEPKQRPPLMDLAEKWFKSITYTNTSFGEYGSYSPTQNALRLCTHDEGTFFHELAHKADDLNGNLETKDIDKNSEEYADGELVAQLSSNVLALLYGYDNTEYTGFYLANWSKTKEPKKIGRKIMKILTRVRKVLDLILKEQELIEKAQAKAKITTKVEGQIFHVAEKTKKMWEKNTTESQRNDPNFKTQIGTKIMKENKKQEKQIIGSIEVTA